MVEQQRIPARLEWLEPFASDIDLAVPDQLAGLTRRTARPGRTAIRRRSHVARPLGGYM